jgi:hypothetical protein
MYPEQFDDFKEEFSNDPEVFTLIQKLKEKFDIGFKKHLSDQLDEDDINDGINTIYDLMRDDSNPDDYTIFDVLLISDSFL